MACVPSTPPPLNSSAIPIPNKLLPILPPCRSNRRRISTITRRNSTTSRRTRLSVGLCCSSSLKRENGNIFPKPSGLLNRAGRKTLDVVRRVEAGQAEAEMIKKATRLLPQTLLEALTDRIHRQQWQYAVKVFELLREQEWYEPEVGTYIRLLGMLGKCKQPDVAGTVFRMMLADKCRPTVQAYTALLTVYTRSNLLDNAFSLFEEMKMVPNCQPDIFTYTVMIKACSEALLFDHVATLLSELRSVGLKPNIVTFNTLVDAYGRAGMFTEMEDVFMMMMGDEEFQPDSCTQNTILRSFARQGNIGKMEYWYQKLQTTGFQPNIMTFNILLHAYGKEGLYEKMNHVMEFMHKYHYSGNTVTYNILIDAYGKSGLLNLMKDAHDEMKAVGVKEDSRTFCSLIDAYGKKGYWKKVEKVMRQVRNANVEPDTAVFNAALDAYRRAEKIVEMDRVLLEMKERGCQADKFTHTILSMADKIRCRHDSLVRGNARWLAATSAAMPHQLLTSSFKDSLV